MAARESTGGADPSARGARTAGKRDSSVERLFETLLPGLIDWTRGRLPRRARRRMDSGDLVQEACVGALKRIPDLDTEQPDAMRAYLQQCIRNRIRDELRRAGKGEVQNGDGDGSVDGAPSPLDTAILTEDQVRFRRALALLSPAEQELVVGRVDLDLSYEHLALATGRPSADAARVATRRAVLRLAREMGRVELSV
jgi:RNA polymerase sigma factor (sigma-70 family)